MSGAERWVGVYYGRVFAHKEGVAMPRRSVYQLKALEVTVTSVGEIVEVEGVQRSPPILKVKNQKTWVDKSLDFLLNKCGMTSP